jgi:hypothetical protein
MELRPSPREICKKLADALEALEGRRFMIGLTKHLIGDLEELGLDSADDLPGLLIELLKEIRGANPIQCYAGTKPPQRSYEDEIRKPELWAYSWNSSRFGKQMYLKFALKNGLYVYVDCHEDRPPEERL